MRRLYDNSAGALRLLHDPVDFVLGQYVVPDDEVGRVRSAKSDARIVGDASFRPKRELESGLQVKERH